MIFQPGSSSSRAEDLGPGTEGPEGLQVRRQGWKSCAENPPWRECSELQGVPSLGLPTALLEWVQRSPWIFSSSMLRAAMHQRTAALSGKGKDP